MMSEHFVISAEEINTNTMMERGKEQSPHRVSSLSKLQDQKGVYTSTI